MSKKRITDDVRAQVDAIVEQFNEEEMPSRRCFYVARFRGSYLCLDRSEWGRTVHVCRLKYNGAMDNWDFSIFKYSKEHYDPEEWMFPGAGHVDGTIEGAMRAGLMAYPV